jgi:DNA mismatch repair protein MutL
MPTPRPVRLLSEAVANKIAAGEVVERPASVVKELMENALDAGATQVDVELVAGGARLVSVRDNGSGMGRDDALLAVERHATSKIRDVSDIEHIGTLGFRGEALAAIASVSRFHLTTCAEGQTVGTALRIAGGTLQDVSDAGCPPGTVIEVRDLFFNVPARRKFMRGAVTELAHARAVFTLLALSHPATGFSLRVDGREEHRLPAGASSEERIRELFGSERMQQVRPMDRETAGVRVHGFAGVPSAGRSDRSEQYIFVNGRATSAPVIAFALKEAYHTLMPDGRHPSLFVFVELPAEQVDVNVHPTKREVRFRDTSTVRDAVIAAVRSALDVKTPVRPAPAVARPAERQLQISDLPFVRPFAYPGLGTLSGVAAPSDRAKAPPAPSAESKGGAPAAAGAVSEPEPAAPWTWCRVVGQIGSLYVLLETEDGYVILDPHAAHERVLFERYLKAVEAGRVESQRLLVPESVEMESRAADRLRRQLDAVRRMGFDVSEFGSDAFVVDAVPACFAGARAGELLTAIARHLEEAGARGGQARWREEAVAQAACKAAVKARDRLSLGEVEQLVADLARADLPYTCPHGRPTMVYTSFRDLNRKFGRE